MNVEQAREYCLSLKGCEECFPFDDVTLVFKVMGKMFAVLPLDTPNRITLKCDPDYAVELREHYDAVEPAFHFNKKYWNQVVFNLDVDDRLLCSLIDHSLSEVIKKLPKALRNAYAEV